MSTSTPEFVEWPKIRRLFRPVLITEKIDGTNAAIGITEDGEVYAQSRKQIITPERDNFGFAAFVRDNADELVAKLGAGLHFGEWYGSGIQKNKYLLPQGEKRLALFNVKRWADADLPAGLHTVPLLYEGPFSERVVQECLTDLRENGSRLTAGATAEGLIVYHVAANLSFKVTCENDEMSKGEAENLGLAA